MKTRWAILALLGGLIAAGCSDSTGPAGSRISGSDTIGSTSTAVLLAFAVGESVPVPDPVPGAGYAVSDGRNTIVITKAEVVLKEIGLKRESAEDGSSGDDEEFVAGPFVLDVALDGATEASVSVTVPDGIYTGIEFEIHRLVADSVDFAVTGVFSGFTHLRGKSIRVQGTFADGTGAPPAPFVFWTDLDVEQEVDFVTQLVVNAATGVTNLTVRLGLDAWFVGAGGALIDPVTANRGGANESQVRDNILTSMEAIENHDDGSSDDDSSSDDDDSDDDHDSDDHLGAE